MVARDGIEPPTPAFSGLRSTTRPAYLLPHPGAFSTGLLRWDEHRRAGDPRPMTEKALCSLTPGVHLVVIRPIRESRAFRDESLDPRLERGMWQVPVSRL